MQFLFHNSPSNKANIFLGLIEYELNSLLGASHLVDYISVHIRFDLERYLLNINPMDKLGDCHNNENGVEPGANVSWFKTHIANGFCEGHPNTSLHNFGIVIRIHCHQH